MLCYTHKKFKVSKQFKSWINFETMENVRKQRY